MSKLPASLLNKASRYKDLTQADKKSFLEELYINRQMSFPEIAELVGTYTNKIRRDAIKLGIKPRNISEAQTVALETGRNVHPTEGKELSEDTKLKISKKMANTWAGLSDKERAYRSEIGEAYWNSLSDAEKNEIHSKAGQEIRRASREGSKLEKYLFETLTKERFIVEFHREQVVTNQRLQLDLFLPELKTAIEVDGPSHFKPVWGQDVLNSNMKSDHQKNGLVLAQGWCLIRLRQTQGTLSHHYRREVTEKLLEQLRAIKAKFPPKGSRLIIIGGEEYE